MFCHRRTVLLWLAVLAQAVCTASARAADAALDLASLEARLQEVSARVMPSVVRFGYDGLWFGSGVIVTPEGHVAMGSSVSCVLKNELLELRTSDGRRLKGEALGWSSSLGLGMLKITEPGPWPHVEISGERPVGALCLGLGYPSMPELDSAEQRPSLRFGVITQNCDPHWFSSSYRFLAGVHNVFDFEGRLIGWNSNTPVGSDPIHVPADLLEKHWDDLLAGKNLDREWLSGKPVDASDAAPRSAPDESDTSGTLKLIIAKATAASARITKPGDKGNVSGTVITADGYVATCGHHRWLSGDTVNLAFADGRDAIAVVLGKNLICDVGLMKIIGEGPWPHVEFGDSSSAEPGTECIRIGFPVAKPGRAAWVQQDVEIIRPKFTLARKDYWHGQFWADGFSPDTQGASGGGVFTREGCLIGMYLGGVGDQAQQARIELIRSQWDELAAGRSVDVLKSEPLADVKAALEPLVQKHASIVVKLMIQGKQQALGTIVRSDGVLLTRADMPAGDITCELADGRTLTAKPVKRFAEHNLAVLKVDVDGLPVAEWPDRALPSPGCLVAAVVPDQQQMIGVISNVGKSLRRKDLTGTLIGTDLRLRNTACGGPVVDRTGQILGISIKGQPLPSGLEECLILPAKDVKTVLAKLSDASSE